MLISIRLFLFFFSLSPLLHIISAERNSTSKWSDQRIREMLLMPDGKRVNFDVLAEIVEFIVRQDAHSRNNQGAPSFGKSPSPSVHPNIPESEASAAINQYIQVGARQPTTSSLEFSVACDLCASVFDIAGAILTSKSVWPTTLSIVRVICKRLYSDRACDGMVDIFGDLFGYVSPEMVKHPYTMCGVVLKSCGAPDNARDLWVVSIPPRLSILPPVEVPPTNEDKFTILYMTDLHIDPHYQPGSPTKCREPMCCRPDSTPKNTPVPENEKSGYWGDYNLCNPATWTFDDILRQINETHANETDFVLINGDLLPHDLWSLTPQDSIDAYNMVSQKLEEKLPGKPIFFGLGNHDAYPLNCYNFPDDPEQFSAQWLYDGLIDIFTRWVDNDSKAEAVRTFKKAGFYTTLLKPKLRLITLNSNYAYFTNFYILGPADITDPYGQLEWMVDLLAKAETNGERVIILSHMVPGHKDTLAAWSWNYYRIIDRFSHIIAAQLFGHIHKDFFTLFYDAQTLTKPKHVGFAGPPATTYPLNNIAYRLYDFNVNPYTLANYRQYYADIGEANASGNNKTMPWKLHYSAKEEYSLPDMSAESWADFAKRMKANETLYNIYRGHWNIDVVTDLPCAMDCATDNLCTIYQGMSHVTSDWCEHFVPTKEPDVDGDPSKRKCSGRFAKYPDSE